MPKLSLTKKYITYPKYKDSGIEWVGDVPVGWDVATSRRLFQTKKQLASETESQTVLSLTLQGVIPRVLDGSGKNPANYDTYQEFQKDDLVFCLFDYDVTPRTIGYVGENGMMTGAYTRLIPKAETSSRFFYYYFLYLDYTKELLHLCTGLRNSISKPVFWSLKNPLPPKEEQEKIARFLDEQTARIDETIAKKERLIELLKEKRTATINHAVTKGLDPKAELVDSGIDWIGKIPKGWQVRPVKELFKISRGRVIAKTEIDMTKQYPVYSSQTKNDGVMGYIDTYDFDRSALTWTTDGANAGTVFYREGKFNCTNVCGVLTPKTEVELKYFVHSVQVSATPNKRLDTNGYKIMSNEMKNIFIVVPPAIEQKKIADFLSELSTKALSIETTLKKSITLLLELKSSLISHAVTGKIKV